MDIKSERALIFVLFVILLGAGLLFVMNKLDGNKVVIKVPESNNSRAMNDSSLFIYRSQELPEECRLPEYESDVYWWKEHLSHHGNTQFCLEYYSDI